MRKIIIISSLLLAFAFSNAQTSPGFIGKKISDFTLKTLQGNEVSISDYEGKNVILIFLRGKVTNEIWCALCMYQYSEFVEIEKKEKIREKYNTEILFVVPFDEETAQTWPKGFSERLDRIEQWKHPEDTANLPQGTKDWMYFCQETFPKKFEFTEDNVPMDLPVLMDTDKKVSKGFDLYRYQWDGTRTDQNIPTIFILDKDGVIKFKYMSQVTQDRPDAAYLLNYIEKML